MRNSILASMAAVLAVLVAQGADPAAQARQRVTGEGFVSEGIPRCRIHPAGTETDLSERAGPRPPAVRSVPPTTPAGEAIVKATQGAAAPRIPGAPGRPPGSATRITCDPLGFPRSVLIPVTNRGGCFGSAPAASSSHMNSARLARNLDGWPRAAQGRRREVLPNARYGYSVGR